MKRYIIAVLLIVLCAFMTGCGLWMDGEYLSVTPHQEHNVGDLDSAIEITSYAQLSDVLSELVTSGAASGSITAPSLNQTELRRCLDEAVDYVMHETPIGAYAVEDISYEVGTNRGEFAIGFHIDYFINRSDILRIKQAETLNETTMLIGEALDGCEDSLTILFANYENTDFSQVVRAYANNNPDTVMEIPQVTARVYPEEGTSRVVDVRFTYQTDREKLLDMQKQVGEVFTSAELYVKDTAQIRSIYARLYSFLMERHEYSYDTTITPSYSLLQLGIGDSRAFANVYAAMCRRVGLDCQVINGTKNDTPWSWNLVRFRGAYYHVDLLQCSVEGTFKMLQNTEMTGYFWEQYTNPVG